MKVNGKEMNLDDGITIDELLSKIKIYLDMCLKIRETVIL